MDDTIHELKRCIKDFRDVDDEIRGMNKILYQKRDTRKCLEAEMSDIIKLPMFDSYKTLKIEDDGSTIRIQRPEMYSKSWTLSKKDLQSLLEEYFESRREKNAKDCFDYICADRKVKLVAKEFSFTRVVPDEEDS